MSVGVESSHPGWQPPPGHVPTWNRELSGDFLSLEEKQPYLIIFSNKILLSPPQNLFSFKVTTVFRSLYLWLIFFFKKHYSLRFLFNEFWPSSHLPPSPPRSIPIPFLSNCVTFLFHQSSQICAVHIFIEISCRWVLSLNRSYLGDHIFEISCVQLPCTV